jgi:ABC-type spermidine/putrescine transport system permease subunit I
MRRLVVFVAAAATTRAVRVTIAIAAVLTPITVTLATPVSRVTATTSLDPKKIKKILFILLTIKFDNNNLIIYRSRSRLLGERTLCMAAM